MKGPTIIGRARAYVDQIDPAISGAGGHGQTFKAAAVLVEGFALTPDEALPLMLEYSSRCSPPWSEYDLRHKLNSAAQKADPERLGHLLASNGNSRPLAPRPQPKTTTPPAPAADSLKVYGWTPPGAPVAIYYYNRPDGAPLYRKVRYKTSTGKMTPFQRYDQAQDAWLGGPGCMNGVERVLYRNEQIPFRERIFIVEGEKSADLLWDLGIMATCGDSGAGHWRPEYSEHLEGKDCVILPDNDDPGRKHARLVAAAIWEKARSVRILDLPGLGPKEDVYDWLLAHGETL